MQYKRQKQQQQPSMRLSAAACRAEPDGSSSGGSGGEPAPPAPPRGAALTPLHAAAIERRWAPLLPGTPQERNKLLSRRMKALTHPDPFAFDVFKADGRQYM